jgi:membrane-bound metal-dependent hydrolase YbcI (DUF457 family)
LLHFVFVFLFGCTVELTWLSNMYQKLIFTFSCVYSELLFDSKFLNQMNVLYKIKCNRHKLHCLCCILCIMANVHLDSIDFSFVVHVTHFLDNGNLQTTIQK